LPRLCIAESSAQRVQGSTHTLSARPTAMSDSSSSGGKGAPKIAGYLRLSEKQKRKNSKGQELFRFVPLASQTQLSEHFPGFDKARTNVNVPSAAASRLKTSATAHLPDMYALVTP
jgi:hypothetical protein